MAAKGFRNASETLYTPSLPNKKRPNKKIGVYVAGHDIFLKVRKSNSSHRKNTCGKIQCLGLKPLDGHESGPQGTDLDENFGTPYHFLRRFRKSQSRGRFRPSRDRKFNFSFSRPFFCSVLGFLLACPGPRTR